jgi:2-iminobutanoate/2-iminopropanoate deaminase
MTRHGLLLGAFLAVAVPASAQRRVGDTLYIGGQLGQPRTGGPAAMDVQARQAMDGVGAVLQKAGLGFQHLVKCHVYLANMDDYAAMNAAYGSYFADRVPARTTIQAAALPNGAGVQIACIAYADLTRISVVRPPPGSLPAPLGPYSPAVWAGDTLYLSGMGGQDPATKTVGESIEAQVTQTVANITTTLKAAGLGVSDVVWAQAYATRLAEAPAMETALTVAASPPHGLVVVPRLPGPIRAELTFVASKGPASTVYAAVTPVAGGGVQVEAREAFGRLYRTLRQRGFGLRDVALMTVYLTDVADLPRVDAVFAETFPADPPARVTIQVQAQGKELVRLTAIAAR